MESIILRPATIEDYETFYAIKADANNVKWSGFDKAPHKENFRVWYLNQLANDSDRKLYLLQVDSKIVGYSSVSYVIPDEPEISYGVLTEESGKGFGTEIIKRTTSLLNGGGISAWVSVNNKASMRCFEKAGFKRVDETEERTLAMFDEPHTFCKWIKE